MRIGNVNNEKIEEAEQAGEVEEGCELTKISENPREET